MPYESAEIPFITIGNKQALSGTQLHEQPELLDFVKRFPDCFEMASNGTYYVYFWPPGSENYPVPKNMQPRFES